MLKTQQKEDELAKKLKSRIF